MRYIMSTELNYYFECLNISMNIFNGYTIANLKNDILKKYEGFITEEDLTPLFDGIEGLMEKIENETKDLYKDKRAELLFKKIKDKDLEKEPYWFAFYLYEIRKCMEKNTFMDAFVEYITTAFNNNEEEPNISTPEELFEFINSLKCDAEYKMDLLTVFFHFDSLNIYINELVDAVQAILIREIPKFNNQISEQMKEILQEIKLKGPSIVHPLLGMKADSDDILNLYPMLSNPNAVTLVIMNYPAVNIVYIGIAMYKTKKILEKAKKTTSKIEEFLKVLADSTKLAILKKLREDNYYNSQLANFLNLTSSTITHHMATLIELGLVTINKQGNRIYNHLDKKQFKAYTSDLSDMFD